MMVSGVAFFMALAFSVPLAKGFLLGSVVAMLLFTWKVRQAGVLSKSLKKGFSFGIVPSGIRLLMYSAVLYKAYSMDREHFLGFIGAAAGIFVISVIVLVIGYMGLDLRKDALGAK